MGPEHVQRLSVALTQPNIADALGGLAFGAERRVVGAGAVVVVGDQAFAAVVLAPGGCWAGVGAGVPPDRLHCAVPAGVGGIARHLQGRRPRGEPDRLQARQEQQAAVLQFAAIEFFDDEAESPRPVSCFL